MWETVGQILGYLGVMFAIASYQMKTQKRVLICLTVGAFVFCVHYFLIGGISGLVLNAIAILRNLVFYFKNKPWYKPILFPLAFAIAMGASAIFFWDGFYTLFITAGLVINTVCVSFSSTQLVRTSILVSSPLCLTYNVFARSYAGMINETLVIISAIVGLVRYGRNKAALQNARETEGEKAVREEET